MRISVIKSDGLVVINGKGYSRLDVSSVPEGVSAIQWYGSFGEYEYEPVNGVKPPNLAFASDEALVPLVQAWQEAADAEANYKDPEPVITPEDRAKLARLDRDEKLKACDWTQLADIPEATRLLWQPYRQALRDVPSQPGFPDVIDWPTAP